MLYHQQTKHHLHRYARALGYLDWATQPDPFRTYRGAFRVDLPLRAEGLTTSHADLYTPGAVGPCSVDLGNVAVLFELALGLSAWKQFQGSRWALRCNPSSGNLHPTEGYAILPELPGLKAGVYHYVSRDHCLERRCALDGGAATMLAGMLPPACFLVGLSSIHWREAWKYGERAFRYCQHDVGHALAAVRYAAAALGWSALLLDHLGDDTIAHWLGLDRAADFAAVAPADREHPDALLLIGPPPLRVPVLDRRCLDGATWAGNANPLSPSHVPWEAIDDVAVATRKPSVEPAVSFVSPPLPELPRGSPVRAAMLIRQRRSCLDLDGKSAIDAATLYVMLDHLLPRPGVPPWDVLPWGPNLHAVVFVHRVGGVEPGMYLFERDPAAHAELRASCSSAFAWERPANCPEHVRLFRLAGGDFRAMARTVSCHQDIAADGAFSLGMLAWFAEGIRARGAWWYRRLFWEAGVLGQELYLGAEAAGVRGTGIGCYFDDAVHQLLGLKDDRWQSLYHFTVGTPVDDPRLITHAPYAHLSR